MVNYSNQWRLAMTHYRDRFGEFFGRHEYNGSENILVLHVKTGAVATQLDSAIYPVWSTLPARYLHPYGIVLSVSDAKALGIRLV